MGFNRKRLKMREKLNKVATEVRKNNAEKSEKAFEEFYKNFVEGELSKKLLKTLERRANSGMFDYDLKQDRYFRMGKIRRSAKKYCESLGFDVSKDDIISWK